MEEIWARLLVHHDPSAREELITSYVPLVKKVVGRMMMTLSSAVEYDDLLSYGIIGLIDAIEKFDPERGYKFETYAVNRIRGTIYDELRALDWIPRSVRQKAKQLEKAYSDVENSLGRSATDAEVAEYMGLKVTDFDNVLNDVNRTSLLSIEEYMVIGDSDASAISDRIEDKNARHPDATLVETETIEELSVAIDKLPDREKTVISLYYYEKMTLKEIGKILCITESRVCQLHTRAILRLRGSLPKV